MRRTTTRVLFYLLISPWPFWITASPTAAASPETPVAPVPGTIADLAFMAGSWSGVEGTTEMDEHWTAPGGGAMLGLHRDVAGGKMVSFEYARIEERADGVFFMASPRGKPATPFRLVKLEGKKAVFENPEHDFPQRIIYWLEADGSLSARIEGTQGGKEASEQWRWRPSSLK